MSKKKKHESFGNMIPKEVENFEKSGNVLVFIDAGSSVKDNSFAIKKTESFIEGEFVGNGLVLHLRNQKRKNLAIFHDQDIVRLKDFLNKHF